MADHLADVHAKASLAVAVLVAALRPKVDMGNVTRLLGLYSPGQRSEVLLVFETAIDKMKEIEATLQAKEATGADAPR